MNNSMTHIPQNYKNNVDWILRAYIDAGVTFPNGFQKDAIQNAVGARKIDKWKDWSCDISLIENEYGISYYRTRSYSSNNSSFLFYLEVISYH